MTALRNVSAIVEKEWRHYFGSPIAYVALCLWTLLFGLFFTLAFYSYAAAGAAPHGQYAQKLALHEQLIRPLLSNMAVVMLFFVPALTMRLFAEEKRQGTMELLATAPLTDWQIVIGKFLGAFSLFAVMVLVPMVDCALLWWMGDPAPDWRPLVSGVLVLLLFGAASIALGMFLSSVTKNQIVAGLLTFSLFLVLWLLGWLDNPTAAAPLKVLAYLGITNHLEDMVKGVIDLKDVVYYLSLTTFGLFLTRQWMESERWRA